MGMISQTWRSCSRPSASSWYDEASQQPLSPSTMSSQFPHVKDAAKQQPASVLEMNVSDMTPSRSLASESAAHPAQVSTLESHILAWHAGLGTPVHMVGK